MVFTIEQKIATLSKSETKEKALTFTSWNGNPAKLDIRTWIDTGDDDLKPGKGITLNAEEAQALAAALSNYLEGGTNEDALPF